MSREHICQTLKPFPMAPYVFITEETTADDLARYFADIKACGFDAVRTGNAPTYLGPDEIDYTVSDLFFRLAEEHGLLLFPHFQMSYCGWMGAAPHAIDPVRNLLDERYHALLDAYFTAVVRRYREHPALLAWIGIGEPGSFPEALLDDPQVRALYRAWLQEQYGSLPALEHAWGFGSRLPYGHEEVTAWDAGAHWAGQVFEKYRHQRDWLRFQTEFLLEQTTTCERVTMREDDRHPLLTGIHNVLANAAAKTATSMRPRWRATAACIPAAVSTGRKSK